MKKLISILLLAMIFVSFSACRNLEDYVGEWHSNWTYNGAEISTSLFLYEDGTVIEKSNSSTEGYEEFLGEWKLEGDKIVVKFTRLVEGEDLCFDKNGRPIEGTEYGRKFKIVNESTLKCGNHYYDKKS